MPDRDPVPHKISVYIALKNKKGNVYTFDVTDQVNNAPDPRNVHIVITGLELPDDIDPDPGPGPDPDHPDPEGGMTVTIEDWTTIIYDLPMP